MGFGQFSYLILHFANTHIHLLLSYTCLINSFSVSPCVHTADYLSLFVKCISKATSERNGMMRTGLRAQLTEFLLLSHPGFHVEDVLAAVWKSVAEFPSFSASC